MAITKEYWSATNILERVKDELDLNEETFIDDQELIRYCNAAIDRAEQQLIGIHKDYFLTSETLSLVSGTREYALPSTIYGHKIRRIIYEQGSQVYKVTRIQDWKKFERKAIEDVNNSATLLEYFLVNDAPGEPRIMFVPVPAQTGPYVTVWYVRQSNRFIMPVSDPTNILDMPEAFNYVVEFVKMKCDIKEKRAMGQIPSGNYPEVDREYQEFIGVLEEIVPDAENLIEADFSAYEEHS